MKFGKVMRHGNLNSEMDRFSFITEQDIYYDTNINPYDSGFSKYHRISDKEDWLEFLEDCSDDFYLWLKKDALILKNKVV